MVFPKPKTMRILEGTYRLRERYETKNVFDFFQAVRGGTRDVAFCVEPDLGEEAYRLDVGEDGVRLTASGEEGFYRATTTLFALVRGKRELPYAQIEDAPDFPHRAYMLDISRGRMPKPEELRRIVDYLSELKYNELQLYMEGDCFHYSAFPAYTADFDCLSPTDVEALDRYCAARFIRLVPNQNSFGHLLPWLEKDEFRAMSVAPPGESSATINPLLPESLDFIDKLYGSVFPHFQARRAHIGMDEAMELGLYQTKEYCDAHGSGALFLEWLEKLVRLAKEKYGKDVMVWADMFHGDKEVIQKLPKDVVCVEWGYDLIQSQMMTQHCMEFQSAGLRYWVSPAVSAHCSFTGRFDVATFNIRTAAELGRKFGAEGIMLTDWGNGGHPQFWAWSAALCALCGQYAWNAGAEQRGAALKPDFIRAAERFADERWFGASGVSEMLARFANYYLVEPERMHNGTVAGNLFELPLSETRYRNGMDLKDVAYPFYFEEAIHYLETSLAEFDRMTLDGQMKWEIRINVRMAILAERFCLIRIGKLPSETEREALVREIDEISREYRALWRARNYEKGVELFLSLLAKRREELQRIR